MPERGGRERTILLHIGTHKTGTTYIQSSLHAARQELSRRGIHYLGPESNHSFLYLLFCESPEREHDMIKRGLGEKLRAEAWISERLQALDEELAASVGHILISGEELCRLSPGGVERLRNFLERYASRFRILCYIREPFEFCLSDAQEALKGGLTLTQIVRDPPVAACRLYLEKYIAQFGRDAVEIRPFSCTMFPGNSLLPDFLTWLRAGSITIAPQQRRANASITHEAALILSHINSLYPPFIGASANPRRAPVAHSWLAQIRGSPFGLPASAFAAMIQATGPHLDWLEEQVKECWFERTAPEPQMLREDIEVSPFLASLAELIHEIACLAGDSMCELLLSKATGFDRDGDPVSALAFSRRALSMRPGNRRALSFINKLSGTIRTSAPHRDWSLQA